MQGFNSNLNITKFLAACSSHGISSEDLFVPDDLADVSGRSLRRVAHTIIVLYNAEEEPSRESLAVGDQELELVTDGFIDSTLADLLADFDEDNDDLPGDIMGLKVRHSCSCALLSSSSTAFY